MQSLANMSFQGFSCCRFIHHDYYSHLGPVVEKTILLSFFHVQILVFLSEICEASKPIAHLQQGRCLLSPRKISAQLILLRQTRALLCTFFSSSRKDRQKGQKGWQVSSLWFGHSYFPQWLISRSFGSYLWTQEETSHCNVHVCPRARVIPKRPRKKPFPEFEGHQSLVLLGFCSQWQLLSQ